jgi:hypothetical protein
MFRSSPLHALLLAACGALALTGCAGMRSDCAGIDSRNLESAFEQAKSGLGAGCAAHFDRYLDDLLATAEGDPKPENKRLFSEFLVWASDEGLISKEQARGYYNRYFNVKFVSLAGDYNNCSQTCPDREQVMRNMERELTDKERGLVRVSRDNEAYYRSDELYREVELVLQATCTACAAGSGR